MKKLCSVVAAGAMVAASIAPALAADVEVGGEVRVRYQENDGVSFVKDAFNKSTTQRTRLNAKAKVDDKTTVFISIQDQRAWGTESALNDTAAEASHTTDLSKGYLQIDNLAGPVGLKIGRQALVYGNQRLLGGFEWDNGANRWDAIKLMYKSEPVDVDVIKATRVNGDPTGGSERTLSGVYATLKMIPGNILDIYRLNDSGQDGLDENWTGVRVAGKAAGADWTAEYIINNGAISDTVDRDATALAITGGYTIAPAANMRVGLEYVQGTGDEPGVDDNEGFNTIAATNHPHYGLHDNISGGGEGQRLNNLTAAGINVTLPNLGGVKLRAEVWDFKTTEDVGVEDEYGQEMNIQAWYSLTEKTKLHAYYMTFEPGDAILTTPTNDETGTTLVVQLHTKF